MLQKKPSKLDNDLHLWTLCHSGGYSAHSVKPLSSGPSGCTCLVRCLEENKTRILSFALVHEYYLLEITGGKIWRPECTGAIYQSYIWYLMAGSSLPRLSLQSEIQLEGMCLSRTPRHKHSHTPKPMCRSFMFVASIFQTFRIKCK